MKSIKRVRVATLIILLIALFGHLSALLSNGLNSNVLIISSILLVIGVGLNVYLLVKES